MKDESVQQQILSELLQRREKLSSRQRQLLDALAARGGVDIGQATPGGKRAPADGNSKAHQEGSGPRQPAGDEADKAADRSGARLDASALPFNSPLFNLLRQLLGDSGSAKAFKAYTSKWHEWLSADLLEALSRPAEQASPAPQTRRSAQDTPSPLITIRRSGSKIPFFCVHALLGSVFHYHRLASLMDEDQPFYALQAPGLDGSEPPLESVDAFARLYLRAVREVQPVGPYKLGGYSFGSWIALEIANRLVEEGDTVSFIGILGTDVPLSVSMPLLYDQLSYLGEYSAAFQHNILEPFVPYQQRVKRALGQKDDGHSSPLWRVVMAHNKAALRFAPKPHPGRLTLFETSDQQMRNPFDISRGWKRLSTVGVDTHLVSGNHLSMLDEPHVQDLAEKLTRCLNQS
jgi:thioesterase domain-containing protein